MRRHADRPGLATMGINGRQEGSGTPAARARSGARDDSVRAPAGRQNRAASDARGERLKELTALHAAAEVLVQSDEDAAAVLQAMAELLPAAFQFPEVAGACICIGEVSGKTAEFADSQWALTAPFTTGGGLSGCVKVTYSEERPPAVEGAFLAEERSLLDTIARMVCAAFEHRALRAALREAEEQLRRVAESIDEVYWLYDWETGEHIYLNAAFEKVWGAKVAPGPEIARVFLDSIVAEDRPAVDAFLEQQRQQLPCDVRYRIRRPDGSVRWIHDRAFPIRGPGGRPYRTAAIAKDVTAGEGPTVDASSRVARLALLTPKQREVLQLLAGGHSVKEAAFRLGRSPKTVETHKADLMQRLEIHDLPALVRFAMRHGLVR